MAMRETVGSLRAYFILSGVASLLRAGSALRDSRDVTATIILGVSVVFSLAFLYVGFFLTGLLRSSTGRIVTLLYTSAGWTLFAFLLSTLLHGFVSSGSVVLILTLLILWYLLKNVRRLAAEAQASVPGTPASGIS
jgi:hypothetical protein